MNLFLTPVIIPEPQPAGLLGALIVLVWFELFLAAAIVLALLVV